MEQQERVGEVKHQIRQMVRAGFQAVRLAIQGV